MKRMERRDKQSHWWEIMEAGKGGNNRKRRKNGTKAEGGAENGADGAENGDEDSQFLNLRQ